MITTRSELRRVVKLEKELYLGGLKKMLELIIVNDKDWQIYHFQQALRHAEYHYNNRSVLIHKLLYVYYRRKKNTLGFRLGIEIWENSFEPGLRIWHAGAIVVNGYAKIGENCQLRGGNCIGNNGESLDAPVIGSNVILGNGAKVIGKVKVADDIVIGAGAVVVKSFEKPGDVIVGVPAKSLKKGV